MLYNKDQVEEIVKIREAISKAKSEGAKFCYIEPIEYDKNLDALNELHYHITGDNDGTYKISWEN